MKGVPVSESRRSYLPRAINYIGFRQTCSRWGRQTKTNFSAEGIEYEKHKKVFDQDVKPSSSDQLVKVEERTKFFFLLVGLDSQTYVPMKLF